MNELWWSVIGFLLRTLLRRFALELARAWYHLAFSIVSVGVGREARSLWEDEVFGDLELEIWECLKNPTLSRQDSALQVLRRSVDLVWDGWGQRAAYIADAEKARQALTESEEDGTRGGAAFGRIGVWLPGVGQTVKDAYMAVVPRGAVSRALFVLLLFLAGPISNTLSITGWRGTGSALPLTGSVVPLTASLASLLLLYTVLRLLPWWRRRRRRP